MEWRRVVQVALLLLMLLALACGSKGVVEPMMPDEKLGGFTTADQDSTPPRP